jgi:hypothetical protein
LLYRLCNIKTVAEQLAWRVIQERPGQGLPLLGDQMKLKGIRKVPCAEHLWAACAGMHAKQSPAYKQVPVVVQCIVVCFLEACLGGYNSFDKMTRERGKRSQISRSIVEFGRLACSPKFSTVLDSVGQYCAVRRSAADTRLSRPSLVCDCHAGATRLDIHVAIPRTGSAQSTPETNQSSGGARTILS